MVQPVAEIRHVVARSGFTNPLTLAILVSDADFVKVYADDLLLNTEDYVVTGVGEAEGVSIEIVGAEDVDEYVGVEAFAVVYDPVMDQQSNLALGGGVGRPFETALDQQNRFIQTLNDRFNRAFLVPIGYLGDPPTFPLPDPGKALKWNEDGDGLINTDDDPDTAGDIADAVTAAEEAAASAIAAADAQAAAEAAAATIGSAMQGPNNLSEVAVAASARLNIGASTYVPTRTAMKLLDPTKDPIVFLYEAGREGVFVWKAGSYTTSVTNDPQEGVYVKVTAIAASVGVYVRYRELRTYNVEWFGATTGVTAPAIAANEDAIQGAITLAEKEGGGTILFPQFYKVAAGVGVGLSVTGTEGDDIHLVGTSQSSGIYSTTTGFQLLTIKECARGSIYNMIVMTQVFTSTTTDYAVWFKDAVQWKMDNCRVFGGYYNVAITGGACADNTFTRNTFSFATGDAMIYNVDSTAGANGAQHFYRNTFNQAYPSGTVNFDGSWAAGAVYAVGDVVNIPQGYLLQCIDPGTSGGTAPTVTVWYGTDIIDNGVIWRLVGRNGYCGIMFGTNTSYCTVRECDFTAVFTYCIRIRNQFAGEVPTDIHIDMCTLHGPQQIGVWIEAGKEIILRDIEAWNPQDATAATTYGVLIASGNCVDVTVVGAEIHGFTKGVYVNSSNSIAITQCAITDCSWGVDIAANISNTRVVNNELGNTQYGANTTSVRTTAGTGDDYIIALNHIGTSGAVNDLAAGAGAYIAGNV